jgi:hypothetical protein
MRCTLRSRCDLPAGGCGRTDFDKNRDRVLLTDIRREIGKSRVDVRRHSTSMQSDTAIGYGLRDGSKVTPITRLIPKDTVVRAEYDLVRTPSRAEEPVSDLLARIER